MTATVPNPRQSVAIDLLAEISEDARAAHQWAATSIAPYDLFSAPIIATLGRVKLTISSTLGKDAFRVSADGKVVEFSSQAIDLVLGYVQQEFLRPGVSGQQFYNTCKAVVSLFVFHELYHLEQGVRTRQDAGSLKAAFGPDELSKFDVIADVRAAHCAAMVVVGTEKRSDLEAYLAVYRSFLLLSYKLLAGVFGIGEKEHKKKRALGILTSIALVQHYLHDDRSEKSLRWALYPSFTSVVVEDEQIVGLSAAGDNWAILFGGRIASEEMTAMELWESIGTPDPSRIVSFLGLVIRSLKVG